MVSVLVEETAVPRWGSAAWVWASASGAALVLCVRDGRAVLVDLAGAVERELDPGELDVDEQLSEDMREWGRVASAVRRSDTASSGPAAELVSRRGRQLAGRVAELFGEPVGYVDPLSGRGCVLDASGAVPQHAGHRQPAEPAPWLTGLTVSVFTGVLVLFAVLTLSGTLAETSPWLGLGAHVVVTIGLLPSVWLVRRIPIWRWVAFGVAAGIALAWLLAPFALFG